MIKKAIIPFFFLWRNFQLRIIDDFVICDFFPENSSEKIENTNVKWFKREKQKFGTLEFKSI